MEFVAFSGFLHLYSYWRLKRSEIDGDSCFHAEADQEGRLRIDRSAAPGRARRSGGVLRQGPGGDVRDSAGGIGEDSAAAGSGQVADFAARDQRRVRAGARSTQDQRAGGDPGDRGAAVSEFVQVGEGLQHEFEVHGAGTVAE